MAKLLSPFKFYIMINGGKGMKKSVIVFYVLSAIFFIIAIFIGTVNFMAILESANEVGASLSDDWIGVLLSLLTTCSGFFGFSAVLCGIGLILNKIDK